MLSTTFRRTLLVSGLLIAASIGIAPIAKADTASGSPSGEVAAINTLDFTATTGTAIAEDAAFNNTFPIGALAIRNNDPDGWKVTVSSDNAGVLKNGSYSIVYTALSSTAVAGATMTPVTFADNSTAYTLLLADFSTDCADSSGCSGSLTATIGASAHDVPAGTYSDTLHFTLTDR